MVVLGKRKRYGSGKKFMKRRNRRAFTKGVGRSMVSSNRTHSFTRTIEYGVINVSDLAPTYGACVFKLSDLTNSTEFTALFDRYRLNGILFTIEPMFDTVEALPLQSNVNMYLPDIHTVVDYTDNAVPTAISELMEYRTYRHTRGNRVHKRFFKPSVLQSSYESAVATAYSPAWNKWLTTDDPATPHYCLKYAVSRHNYTGATFKYKMYAKYYFQCKDYR